MDINKSLTLKFKDDSIYGALDTIVGRKHKVKVGMSNSVLEANNTLAISEKEM